MSRCVLMLLSWLLLPHFESMCCFSSYIALPWSIPIVCLSLFLLSLSLLLNRLLFAVYYDVEYLHEFFISLCIGRNMCDIERMIALCRTLYMHILIFIVSHSILSIYFMKTVWILKIQERRRSTKRPSDGEKKYTKLKDFFFIDGFYPFFSLFAADFRVHKCKFYFIYLS